MAFYGFPHPVRLSIERKCVPDFSRSRHVVLFNEIKRVEQSEPIANRLN